MTKPAKNTAKKTPNPRARLEHLEDELLKTEHAIRKLEQEHPEIFEQWRYLQQDKEGIVEQIKVEARKFAVQDASIVLYDDAALHVSVTARRKADTFDFAQASKLWPKAAVEACAVREIDAKKVTAALELPSLGLTRALADRARVPGEPLTPAVSIKLT